jgi:DUF4097 and DUF4098 domain-containing protein YvlB
MKKKLTGLAAFGLLMGLMIGTAWSQDFEKSYNLAAGGTISFANVSGDISITGANIKAVTVKAIREGRDKDAVEIIDQSGSSLISFKVEYPRGGNFDASVRFLVEVPSAYEYKFDKLSTASGDIEIINVAGEINASTASGDIKISQVTGNVRANSASGDLNISKVQGDVKASAASGDITVLNIAGMVTANTASGDVEAEVIRFEGNGEMRFASATGDVTVRVPNQLNAQVQISTGSGDIQSDFPLNYEKPTGGGKKASGNFGAASILLRISSASGNACLVKS